MTDAPLLPGLLRARALLSARCDELQRAHGDAPSHDKAARLAVWDEAEWCAAIVECEVRRIERERSAT